MCPPLHEAGAEHDAHANANPQLHCDGEWRKRQIMDVANSLEARYRTLLDTAPSRAPELPTPTPAPPTPTPAPAPTPKTATPPVLILNHAPSPIVPRPPPVLPLPEPTEIIELDSDGEEQSPVPIKVEPALQSPAVARPDPNETLRLRIRFPTRPPPPALPSPKPAPASTPTAAASPALGGSPSPTRPRPKPIFKNPAAPGPYARVPFARRLSLQDAAACEGAPAPSPPHTVALTTGTGIPPASPPSASPTPAPATHLTLRRRPARAAAAQLKPVSPAVPAPAAPPPSAPPPAHAHGQRRPRKRRRVDDVPSPASDKVGAEEAPRAVAEEEEEEEEEEGREQEVEEEEEESEEEGEEEGDVPDGERKGGGTREQRRERWRECALYREAQRHAGTPSARKTHRQLGIFGLRGFPTEIEHTRDFVPPAWALPLGDLRLAQGNGDATSAVIVVGAGETPRRGGSGARMGVVASGGVGVGMGGADKEAGQAHLSAVVMAVTVTGDGEETLLDVGPGKSDPVVTVETPKTVDSQETEDLMMFS